MTTTISDGVLVEKPRISSLDLVRGLVMVIMALDHARDFFHVGNLQFDPTDLSKTSPLLFFTRWITHFCAPTFVFLSGASIGISKERKSIQALSKYLLTRGLSLIILEFIVVRFGIVFNLWYDIVIFQVIWVIGACMMVMAAVIRLSTQTALVVGLSIVFLHNLLVFVPITPADGPFFFVWSLLYQPGLHQGPVTFLVIYPIIPWLGIMISGYAFGSLYTRAYTSDRRQKILLRVGLACVALFVVIRFINLYGDPQPWAAQKNMLFTILSFLNCTKYPPSLLYTLMTLGPIILLLSWLEKREVKILQPLLVFGRVPLFYYIPHFYLLHLFAVVTYMIKNHVAPASLDFSFDFDFGIPLEGRVPLYGVYIAWIAVVVLLYPVCRWYNRYKSTHSHWWLSYL